MQITNKFKLLRPIFRRYSADINIRNDHKRQQDHILELKKYLESKDIPHAEGYTCLKLECRLCIFHNDRNPAYINKRTGQFTCPKCDVNEDLPNIIKLYEQKNKMVTDWREYKFPHKNLCPANKDVLEILQIKGLQLEDLNAFGSCYDDKKHTLHFPLKNSLNLTVGEKIFHLRKRTEVTYQKPTSSGLLISGSEKTKAIVVSNIVDFLVLVAQHLDSHAVVCLPYLLKILPQECLPSLEKFTELIFWFDTDSIGWDASHNISQKLGKERCLLIRPTEGEASPYQANKSGFNIRKILKKAVPVIHKSIITFGALKEDILSELQNIEKVDGVKWKRFPILNKLIKGHRKGELTIITGPTGSGKTTFMSEYSLDLAIQGVSTLWGSFEIRNARLASTLLRQFVGHSLEKKLNEFDHWANQLEKYPLYFMTFHGQQPIKVVMDAIEHAQYVLDINHVIIDNLQFMMGVSGNHKKDRFWEQDEIIACFRTFSTKYNVHVTLVMHPRKEKDGDELTANSIFGSAKAIQEADNVLIIQDKRLEYVRGKKYLQVAKNRYSGDLGIMPLEFNKDSLGYSRKK